MTQVEQQQRKFHNFVSDLMAESDTDLITYGSVIGMVYSLIEDNQLEQIDAVFRKEFPDYYFDKEQSKKDSEPKDPDDFFLF